MNTLTLTITESASGVVVIAESHIVVAQSPRPLADAYALTNQQTMVITLGDVEITISKRLPDTTEEPVGYIDPAIDAQLAAL